MKKRRLTLSVSAVGLLLAAACMCAAEPAVSPDGLFKTAVAVWHMAKVKDSVGKSAPLAIEGKVELGVELTGPEREASVRCGGDGRAARFEGGWLVAGRGANEALNLTGHALTICLRLRDPSGKWAAGLLSKKGNAKNYNLFAWDLGHGMEFGFEFNLRGERQFRQLRTPLEGLAPDAWHDLVVRYDGVKVELFVDGVLRDRKPASGPVAEAPDASVLIGADPGGRNSFHGLVDHAALWDRALTEAEIEFLSGGREAVERARTLEGAARR
ncbi:MAG: LamG domain-containing protein, partial [Planctomycetota bacterium]|nr:LamG domain-containing protein [Planctomycetota bacterium]